jgi:hypothetical protein
MLPLRTGVHAAAVGEDLVLLDLHADRYLCIPAALSPPGAALTPAAAEQLNAAGLIDRDGGAAPGPAARPNASLPPAAVQVTWAERLRLASAVSDYLAGYVARPLGHVLAAAHRGAPADASPPSAELLRLAAVFDRLVVWAPVPRKCLVRSFLLMRFLARSGYRGRWVLGVRTWPFAAHCWVAAGDVALDDSHERLARYTPILEV